MRPETQTDGEVLATLRRHKPTPRAELTDEWPQPQPIQSELPPVQPFSEDWLPVSFRPLVRDVAERMQCPMDYPAVVTVLCLAGVVNRRAVTACSGFIPARSRSGRANPRE